MWREHAYRVATGRQVVRWYVAPYICTSHKMELFTPGIAHDVQLPEEEHPRAIVGTEPGGRWAERVLWEAASSPGLGI